MPYRMHSEYLRRLFLRNDLSGGRYEVDGRPVWITHGVVPVFAVGTEADPSPINGTLQLPLKAA
jgi:polyhydroxyalkanoate synthase subunit PhaC